MPGLYTHTTRASGTTLTSTIYNTDHQNHIDNHIPSMIDDLSANLAAMQATSDPGELTTETLPTTLALEIQQLRHAIKEVVGKTQWYETPRRNLENVLWAVGVAKVADYTVLAADNGKLFYGDGTTVSVEFALPSLVAGDAGFNLAIKAINIDNAVTINPDGADTIDGAASYTFALNEALAILWDGTEWHIVARHFTQVPATGALVQRVITETGAVSNDNTTITADDSIPQITEGTEIMTRTITPDDAGNDLYISVTVHFEAVSTSAVVVALFKDAGADALAAMVHNPTGTSFSQSVTFTHKVAAGSVSLQTFRVRIGSTSGQVVTFNGNTTARLMGGVMASSISITEITP